MPLLTKPHRTAKSAIGTHEDVLLRPMRACGRAMLTDASTRCAASSICARSTLGCGCIGPQRIRCRAAVRSCYATVRASRETSLFWRQRLAPFAPGGAQGARPTHRDVSPQLIRQRAHLCSGRWRLGLWIRRLAEKLQQLSPDYPRDGPIAVEPAANRALIPREDLNRKASCGQT